MRGFALKFYTEQGNWDLVGNNTPVFFIRDPLKFPDFIHTQKRDPLHQPAQRHRRLGLLVRHPESLHQVTILFSDRGIPRSLREMNGYGSHTFSFINSANERFWVKFHFKTEQGHSFYTDEEAATAVGQDRETSQADLFNAIEQGTSALEGLCAGDARGRGPDLLDPPVRSHQGVAPQGLPAHPGGRAGAQPEPGQLLRPRGAGRLHPGQRGARHRLLAGSHVAGRLFSYGDTQRYRLGVNHGLLPVNAPRCPFHHGAHRDGAMRADSNGGASPNYQPNRFGTQQPSEQHEPALSLEGAALHYDFRDYDSDYYSQPGLSSA